MKYFIFQGNDHDCGFASLKMFLATISKDKSYLHIPKPKKRERYNLNDLARISKEYGVPLECYGCSKESYIELENPSLVLIDENHVVMVKKQNNRRIVLYDPGKGIVKMSKDEFLRRWRCVTLYTDYPECVTKIPKTRRRIVPKNLKILETISSILSSIILAGTFFLLNKAENYVYSLFFLFMFMFFQVIEKVILYKQIYNFDKEFIPRYFGLKKNCNKNMYEKYAYYKRTFFTYSRSFLASLLTGLIITFLLCLNDFKNILILIALVLLKLTEKTLFSRREEDRRNVIAELESKCFKETANTKDLALEANIKADGHIFNNSVKDIFYIFATFLFALIMMFATGNIGCNYVIFHFVMYFAGFSAYNQIVDGLSLRKEIQKEKCRFFDSCNL